MFLEGEMMGEDDHEPVSPTGQYFNSTVMSVAILAMFESDVPIDDSPTMATLQSVFLPINSRFSSIMVSSNPHHHKNEYSFEYFPSQSLILPREWILMDIISIINSNGKRISRCI